MTKRELTAQEIDFILDFIKPRVGIPVDTAMAVVNTSKARLRKQLVGQLVFPSIIPFLKLEMEKLYRETLVQPGDSIGICCATSIGEKNTQLTLNTFHRAGQSEKAITAGVPRFQELMSATKKPKRTNCKIYFKPIKDSSIQGLRDVVGHSIVGLTLEDISLEMVVCINKKPEEWYKVFSLLYNDKFTHFKNCISISINLNKLFEHKLTIKEIADTIEKDIGDVFCVFSPPMSLSKNKNNDNEYTCKLDIFVDTSDISLPAERILFINTKNATLVYLEECVIPDIEKLQICGIPGLLEIYYTQEDNEWIVETDGSNLRAIMAHADIDPNRTISNNVWDIYNILGVEAARQFLIEEFMEIMDGINPCHASLLVDRMTYSGSICSISRYTLKKEESGPFGKASFEEVLSNFMNAAAQGDIEPTIGVSSSIICGKRARIGTGMMDIKIDINRLPQAKDEDVTMLETVNEVDKAKQLRKDRGTTKQKIDKKQEDHTPATPVFIEF
jgi:DNA-directed RNA polymerase beta' subunit